VNVFDTVRGQSGGQRAFRETLLSRQRELTNVDDYINLCRDQLPQKVDEIHALVSNRVQCRHGKKGYHFGRRTHN